MERKFPEPYKSTWLQSLAEKKALEKEKLMEAKGKGKGKAKAKAVAKTKVAKAPTPEDSTSNDPDEESTRKKFGGMALTSDRNFARYKVFMFTECQIFICRCSSSLSFFLNFEARVRPRFGIGVRRAHWRSFFVITVMLLQMTFVRFMMRRRALCRVREITAAAQSRSAVAVSASSSARVPA